MAILRFVHHAVLVQRRVIVIRGDDVGSSCCASKVRPAVKHVIVVVCPSLREEHRLAIRYHTRVASGRRLSPRLEPRPPVLGPHSRHAAGLLISGKSGKTVISIAGGDEGRRCVQLIAHDPHCVRVELPGEVSAPIHVLVVRVILEHKQRSTPQTGQRSTSRVSGKRSTSARPRSQVALTSFSIWVMMMGLQSTASSRQQCEHT